MKKSDIPSCVLNTKSFIEANVVEYTPLLIANGIVIKGEKVYADNTEINNLFARDIIGDAIKSIGRVYVPKNNFWSKNLLYSPLEAERNRHIFSANYTEDLVGTFPYVTSTMLSFILVNGMFPTFDEFAMSYLNSYFEESPTKCSDYSSYASGKEPPRYNLGSKLPSNEYTYTNKIIRCNDLAIRTYTPGIINEFTTDMILNRLYKAYPSCVRKLYSIMVLTSACDKAVYNLSDDIYNGVHLWLNDKIVRINTQTKAAMHFANKKIDRSNPLIRRQRVINFNFDMEGTESDEFVLPTDAGFAELIRVASLPRLFSDPNILANA